MDKALETINSDLVWIFDNILHVEAVSVAKDWLNSKTDTRNPLAAC